MLQRHGLRAVLSLEQGLTIVLDLCVRVVLCSVTVGDYLVSSEERLSSSGARPTDRQLSSPDSPSFLLQTQRSVPLYRRNRARLQQTACTGKHGNNIFTVCFRNQTSN